MLTALVAQHGAPAPLQSDNGAAFIATAIQVWLAQSGVETVDIAFGKRWQNGKEERFKGTVRDEWLNLHGLGSLAEAGVRRTTFRHHYNTERPQRALGYLPPSAFKTAWLEAQAQLQVP